VINTLRHRRSAEGDGEHMRAVRVVQHAAPLEALELQDIPVPAP